MIPLAASPEAESPCERASTVWQNAPDAEVDAVVDCIHASSDTDYVAGDPHMSAESDTVSDPVPIDWGKKLVPRNDGDDDPWVPTAEFHYRNASRVQKFREAEARTIRRRRRLGAEVKPQVWRPARMSLAARRRMRRERDEVLAPRAHAEGTNTREWNVMVSQSCTGMVMDFMVGHDG